MTDRAGHKGQTIPRAKVKRHLTMAQRLGGTFYFKARSADGLLLAEGSGDNIVTSQGINYAIGAALLNATPDATWFVGLTNGNPGVAAANTLASHAGWVENTSYNEASRPAWTGVAGTLLATNVAAPAIFTVASGGSTFGGAFLCGVTSGTAGTLYSVAAFNAGNIVLPEASTLEITYIVSGADIS